MNNNNKLVLWCEGELFLDIESVSMIIFFKKSDVPHVEIHLKGIDEARTIYHDHPAYKILDDFVSTDGINMLFRSRNKDDQEND